MQTRKAKETASRGLKMMIWYGANGDTGRSLRKVEANQHWNNVLLEHYFKRQLAWSLRAGRSGDRIPVGARFSAVVQTEPGAHLASYTMGTGSFHGVIAQYTSREEVTNNGCHIKKCLHFMMFVYEHKVDETSLICRRKYCRMTGELQIYTCFAFNFVA